jgi:hypothetical protein
MAVPSTNVTLTSIQTEFGGSNPISLSEYYSGGPLVPSGSPAPNGPIPSSGQISVGQFRGAFELVYPYNMDFLVIAGGGGGGAGGIPQATTGGGGGAGGYRTSTYSSLPSGTTITVTVGNGGAGGPAQPNIPNIPAATWFTRI